MYSSKCAFVFPHHLNPAHSPSPSIMHPIPKGFIPPHRHPPSPPPDHFPSGLLHLSRPWQQQLVHHFCLSFLRALRLQHRRLPPPHRPRLVRLPLPLLRLQLLPPPLRALLWRQGPFCASWRLEELKGTRVSVSLATNDGLWGSIIVVLG